MTARATQCVYCFNHRMVNLSLSQIQKLQTLWPWVCRKPVLDVRRSVLCQTGGGSRKGCWGTCTSRWWRCQPESRWTRWTVGDSQEDGSNRGATLTQRVFLFSIDGAFQKISIHTKHNKQTVRIQSPRLICQISEKHNGLFPLRLQSRWLWNTLEAGIYYFQSPFCKQTKSKHNSYEKSRYLCCYGLSHVLTVHGTYMDEEVQL